MARLAGGADRMRTPESITPGGDAFQRATKRMRIRAVLDLVCSLLMLMGFVFLWQLAYLAVWFVVLGVLLLMQAIGYAVFTYRIKFDAAGWRCQLIPMMRAYAIWTVAEKVVTAQITIVFMIGWAVFSVC